MFTDIHLNLKDNLVTILKTQLINVNKATACLHLLSMHYDCGPRTVRR